MNTIETVDATIGEGILDLDVVQSTLAEVNVTEAVLARIESDFAKLTINGLDDKDGYNNVRNARLYCKNLRVATTKACKAAREEAIKVQRIWVEAEKSVVSRIEAVESRLEAQEKAIDAEKERIKREKAEAEERERQAKARAEAERVAKRIAALAVYGVSIPYEVAQAMPDTDFEAMVANAKEEAEQRRKAEAEAEERRKAEEAKLAEERAQLEEQRRKAEAEAEERRKAEEAKLAEERAQLEADRRRVEEEVAKHKAAVEAQALVKTQPTQTALTEFTTISSVVIDPADLFRLIAVDIDVTFDIDADYHGHDDYDGVEIYTAWPIVSRVEIVNHASGARLDVTQYVDNAAVAEALKEQSLAYWEAAESYVDARFNARCLDASKNIDRLRMAVVQEVA